MQSNDGLCSRVVGFMPQLLDTQVKRGAELSIDRPPGGEVTPGGGGGCGRTQNIL